ncbi:MAG TPA: cyclase family protein [Vicinamibacterales bacterium]|jgi:kynurenine formamidase|nr:cyclase family protein [Vicinamibacterales bacterium]
MALLDALTKARVFDLEQPRFAGMPIHPAHRPGYFYGLHRRHRDSYRPEKQGPRSGSSGVLTMMEHSGTHIDALCHQACDLKFYGGVEVDRIERADGYQHLGAETIRPMICRGVLLDVAKWKGVDRLPPNESISADDLHGCARATGVEVRAGDVLIVRTGYGACWTDEDTYLSAAGVSKSGNIWAADHKVAAVGADNMAWDSMEERDPDTNMTLFGHVHLLVRHGIHIIENLNLEILSGAGHREFCFVGIPLKFRGATGSPIRPLALVET